MASSCTYYLTKCGSTSCVAVAYSLRTDRQRHRDTPHVTRTDKSFKTKGPKILSNYIFYFRTVIIGGPIFRSSLWSPYLESCFDYLPSNKTSQETLIYMDTLYKLNGIYQCFSKLITYLICFSMFTSSTWLQFVSLRVVYLPWLEDILVLQHFTTILIISKTPVGFKVWLFSNNRKLTMVTKLQWF